MALARRRSKGTSDMEHVPWGAGVIKKLWIYVAIDSIDKMNKFECILYIVYVYTV